MVKPVSAPICPYCGGDSVLVTGDVVYPNRPDLAGKRFWLCAGDQAWVGVHGKTERPLGTLADAALRKHRQEVHAVFDVIWQAKMVRDGNTEWSARGRGYKWLAEAMQIPPSECHSALFSHDQCALAIAICAPIARRLKR